MCGSKKMMMGLMVGVFCIAGLPSDGYAEIPLDIEGKQWGETFAFAKACKFEKGEIDTFNKEIIYLLNNRKNSTPYENKYTIKKYKEYSAKTVQYLDKSNCIKVRQNFNFIHALFKKDYQFSE